MRTAVPLGSTSSSGKRSDMGVMPLSLWLGRRVPPELGSTGEHATRREHIHQHGKKFTPAEWVKRATGEKITAEPFLTYLRRKCGQIDELDTLS